MRVKSLQTSVLLEMVRDCALFQFNESLNNFFFFAITAHSCLFARSCLLISLSKLSSLQSPHVTV